MPSPSLICCTNRRAMGFLSVASLATLRRNVRTLMRSIAKSMLDATDPAVARHQPKAVTGDPEVQTLTQGRHAGQVEEGRDRPQQRQAPRHPAKRRKAAVDRLPAGRK